MPGLGDLLYDLFAPQQQGPGYQGVLDMQAQRNPRVQGAMAAGQAMAPDPRMMAYAQRMPQQPPPQMVPQAPQAPGYGDPMSGQTASGQPPLPFDPNQANWADALYKLMSPAVAGGRY